MHDMGLWWCRTPEPQDAAGSGGLGADSFDSLDDADAAPDAAPDAASGWQPPWLAATRQNGSSQRQKNSGRRSATIDRQAERRAERHAYDNSRPPTANAQCQTPCHAHVQTDAAAPLDKPPAAGSSASDGLRSTAEGAHARRPVSSAVQQLPAAPGRVANSAGQEPASLAQQARYRVTIWTADAPSCYTEGRPRIVILGADGGRYDTI